MRIRFLFLMLFLFPALAQAAEIQPCPEDMETVWNVEDTRTESSEPLLTSLKNGDAVLGYDRAGDTFYCTLGLDTGDDWPALSIGTDSDISLVWIDDYTYDFCGDAIAQGTRYEVLAYTDTQYRYFGIVFTGLPIVTVHTDGKAVDSREDVACAAGISAAGYDAVSSAGLIHQRGSGASHGIDKFSYHLELHKTGKDGEDKKNKISVLGMEKDSDWLLLSNAADKVCVSNYICWGLWNDWNNGGTPGTLSSRMTEFFLNDEYMGVYQLMQRMRPEKQMEACFLPADTTLAARQAAVENGNDRPKKVMGTEDWSACELRYVPEGMTDEEAFDVYEKYFELERDAGAEFDDETFAKLVSERFDIRKLVSYFLFVHVTQNRDNLDHHNNVYMWAVKDENGGYRFELSPWDMDGSLVARPKHADIGAKDFLDGMKMIERVLDLDVGGARQLLWDVWNEKKESLLTFESIYARMDDACNLMNLSGAYLRELTKWNRLPAEEDDDDDDEWGEEKEDPSVLTLNTQRDFVVNHLTTIETQMKTRWAVGG